jgi:hypothetical protein
LSIGTTYYVRAYATNTYGTSYGSELSFMSLAIGNSYQGGVVAYILQSGDPGYVAGQTHGLIATASDQSTGIQWYNSSFFTTGASATAIGSGNANTNTIVAAQGAGTYAAKLCYDLSLNGYSDWYLPSNDELYQLYLSRSAIGLTTNNYWSSSEYSSDPSYQARFVYGNGGTQSYGYKHQTLYVRPIRSF